MKMTPLDRVLLLLVGLLAAYQIVVGINDLSISPIIAYTISFGVLLVAVLLLIILGFDALVSPVVVVVSTIIPLSLSVGLVWEYSLDWALAYLVFAVLGFVAIIVTRSFPMPDKLPILVLAFVHGVAGMVIFLLPLVEVLQGQVGTGFSLVGIGGALMGIGGLLLSFLKAGKPILPQEKIFRILPVLLFVMSACYVAGFRLV